MKQELPLRVGIVGCGNVVVRAHAPALFEHPASRVVAVADPVRARVEEVVALLDLGEQAGFSSHAAMFDQADLDYVLVAVPPSLREPIIEDAFRSGLHVLSEKPITIKPSIGKRLIRAAAAHKLNYGMVHNYLYFSEYVLLREKISQGTIGAPRHISLNFLGVPDLPGHADYRPLWRHDLGEAGGGILMDMIHVLYVAEFLIGAEIQAVSGVIDNLGYPGEPIEDIALIHLYFEGAYASVNLGWGHGPGGIEITGSEGRILAFYENYSTGPFNKLDQFVVITQNEVRQISPPENQASAKSCQHKSRQHGGDPRPQIDSDRYRNTIRQASGRSDLKVPRPPQVSQRNPHSDGGKPTSTASHHALP